MGIIKRIGDIFKANVNSALDDIEDSEKMLDEYVREMTEELGKAKEAVAGVIATRNQTRNEYNALGTKIDDLTKKAKLALEKGNEELAKKALTQKKTYELQHDQLETQVATLDKQVETLKGNITQLEMNINEARAKKEGLKAKLNSAKAQEKVNSVMNGIGENSSGRDFDRIAKKIDDKYEKEMAKAELAGDSLANDFRSLEQQSIEGEVDSDLEALKAEMGLSPKNEDKELEDLKKELDK